jgi:hypothetical protein
MILFFNFVAKIRRGGKFDFHLAQSSPTHKRKKYRVNYIFVNSYCKHLLQQIIKTPEKAKNVIIPCMWIPLRV